MYEWYTRTSEGFAFGNCNNILSMALRTLCGTDVLYDTEAVCGDGLRRRRRGRGATAAAAAALTTRNRTYRGNHRDQPAGYRWLLQVAFPPTEDSVIPRTASAAAAVTPNRWRVRSAFLSRPYFFYFRLSVFFLFSYYSRKTPQQRV